MSLFKLPTFLYNFQSSFLRPPSAGRAAPALIAGVLIAAFLAGCSTQSPSTKAAEKAVSTLCQPSAPLKDYSQRALLAVGYEALQQNQLPCAERLLGEAHRLDSKDPWALLNLGVAQQRQGKTEQARVAYQSAAGLDPKTSGIELKAKAISEQKQETAIMANSDGALGLSPGQIALQNLSKIR
jgi:tetratricopeptide (TPR) repeat protein